MVTETNASAKNRPAKKPSVEKESAKKAEAKHKPAEKHSGKMLTVEQTGSAIRRHHSQRETLIGLRLNKIGRTAELHDTPAVRGMIAKGPAPRARGGR